MTEIGLSVDVLKKVLEQLPPHYSVGIQIDNTVWSANTFDISDDYEEIYVKWCDLDYTIPRKDCFRIEDIRNQLKELQEENKQLKQSNKELKQIVEDYNQLLEELKGDVE